MGSGPSDDTRPASGSGAVVTLPQRPLVEPGSIQGDPAADEQLQAAFRTELEDPELVVSPGYIGHDRRAPGWRARLARTTFHQRRSLLSLEFVVAAVVVLLIVVTVLEVGTGTHPAAATATAAVARAPRAVRRAAAPAPAAVAPTPTTTAPAPTTTVPAPTTTVPAPTTTVAPPVVAAPAAAPAPTPTAPPAAPAATTPDQLGQQALALVRYPWQQIPGYNIQFLPIAEAPSPGFYGNTTFTWGSAGGTSVLYVYPGGDGGDPGRHHRLRDRPRGRRRGRRAPRGRGPDREYPGRPPGQLGSRLRLRRAGLPVGVVRRRFLQLLVARGGRLEHDRPRTQRCGPGRHRALAQSDRSLNRTPVRRRLTPGPVTVVCLIGHSGCLEA